MTEAKPCPNADQHVPHPTGYVAHSWWADCAMFVADQSACPGCGGWEVWTPKRPDLRIAVDWPPSDCDWGGCDEEGVAERLLPGRFVKSTGEEIPGDWLPVCRVHTGLLEGSCAVCLKPNLPLDGGVVETHQCEPGIHCRGSGRPPHDPATEVAL